MTESTSDGPYRPHLRARLRVHRRAHRGVDRGPTTERPAPDAHRSRPRGAAVRGREPADTARDRRRSPAWTPRRSTSASGDLEVALRDRGVRLARGRRPDGARDRAGNRRARRTLRRTDAVRLSPAGLETLAIVAYRQPVTRGGGRTSARRGFPTTPSAACSTGDSSSSWADRTAPGRPILYGTAFEFLERFGLESLDDLPALDADVAARLAEEGGMLLLPLDGDDEVPPGLERRRSHGPRRHASLSR